MSTVGTTARFPTLPPVPEPSGSPQLTFAGVMRGEWIKLLSLRSTWWALGVTVALMTLVSFAAAMSLDFIAADPAQTLPEMHGAEIVTAGFEIGMITVAVLGALFMTGEYSTGMIRSTFAAVPIRVPVLAAKATALVVVTTAVTLLGVALSYVVSLPALTEHDLVPAPGDAATWRVVGGTVFFMIAAALFALGIGALLRSTAATVTAALTVLLLLPGILSFITLDWVETTVSYLPLPASAAFIRAGGQASVGADLTAGAGLLVVAAYAAVPLAAAAVALRRRDA